MYTTKPTWRTYTGEEYDWNNLTDAMDDVERCLTFGALSVNIRRVES